MSAHKTQTDTSIDPIACYRAYLDTHQHDDHDCVQARLLLQVAQALFKDAHAIGQQILAQGDPDEGALSARINEIITYALDTIHTILGNAGLVEAVSLVVPPASIRYHLDQQQAKSAYDLTDPSFDLDPENVWAEITYCSPLR